MGTKRAGNTLSCAVLAVLIFVLSSCSSGVNQPSTPPAAQSEPPPPAEVVAPAHDIPLLTLTKDGIDTKLYPGMKSAEVALLFQTPAEDYTVKYFDTHALVLSFGVGEVVMVGVRTDEWTVNGHSLYGASITDIRAIYGEVYDDEKPPYKLPFEQITYCFNENGEIVDPDSPSKYLAMFQYNADGTVIGAGIGYADLSAQSDAPTEALGTIFLEESGIGDRTILTGMKIAGGGRSFAAITHSGKGRFTITADGVSLFERSGPYSGTVFLPDIDAGELAVTVDGEWSIKIASMPGIGNTDSVEGSGDGVAQLYLDQYRTLHITHMGTGAFRVNAYPYGDWEGKYTLLDVSGDYEGALKVDFEADGICVLEILSDGQWRIALNR